MSASCDISAFCCVFIVKALHEFEGSVKDLGHEEFTRIAETYKDMVFRVALNYLGSPCDADDAVQEVLLKLYTKSPVFENENHIKSWLIRVTANHCKSMLRAPWRRSIRLEDIELVFENPEQSGLFYEVMALPEKYRIVLYLHYYEDYSVCEIAELLGIKVSAVTTRLARARNKLKLELGEGLRNEI